MLIWQANSDVHNLVEEVKQKHHLPRLQEARVSVLFQDSKPFIGDRFNWGKVGKFSSMSKLFHPEGKRFDFYIAFPVDGWQAVMNGEQREAWIDLMLERLQVQYVPETVEENGKKKPVKDQWGRINFTDEIKRNTETGEPCWKVDPLDLIVFQNNVRRYSLWCSDLLEFKSTVDCIRA